MISLKRNSKGELIPASGRRATDRNIYKPNQANDFKISRSKFFLLMNKLGTQTN